MTETTLHRIPLYDFHKSAGAKIVPFAGYEMPVYYPSGILSEHKWTRENAGLFDVSHMGQATLLGADFAIVALALEKIVPADVRGLKPGQQRYTQLLNHEGGVIDDLMVVRGEKDGEVHLVVNASRKEIDYHWLSAHLDDGVSLNPHDDLALLALQGPKAADVMAALWPKIHELAFMQTASVLLNGLSVFVSRSGYTGEDGFEISVKAGDAAKLWEILLNDKRVKPIGLGARDSLRLEAGLCLYGHELDETISPVEASLGWSIAKRRRETGGYIGAARVQDEMRRGVVRKRVGIKPEGRAPAREGTEIHDGTGQKIGVVTSGGFGPSVNGTIAMGYVKTDFAAPSTPVYLIVRGQALPAQIVTLPFIPHRFKR